MSTPRMLVVPGGTSIGAVALANASIHKIVELWEERQEEPDHPAPHTITVLRDPNEAAVNTLRNSQATPQEAFPADKYPELQERLADPHFFDGIDLIVPTSGSSAGVPRLVGLSIDALIASARASEAALDGPGRWILALPTHHIAGVMVLLRAAVAGTNPQFVDTSNGFNPADMLPAINGATQDVDTPSYTSLVPTQLAACLDAGDEVVAALTRLSAVLVGGSAIDADLLTSARERGINVVTTYGMTETCGGCVYDGFALPGVTVRAVDRDGRSRIAISGPTLMTRYLEGESPTFDEDGRRWLLTGDVGSIRASGQLVVEGRADDVIVSGGLSISPQQVRAPIVASGEVTDAWVIGTPDEKWGQVVTAVVVTTPPTNADEMDALGTRVREAAASVVGRVQAPRRVVVVDALPMTDLGKVERAATMELAEAARGTIRDWWR
ncbi:AMP-binding protein [Schaalia vaccimaxillae]|uniref:AMP-binding protein n=1 Tax=Schaalia vaccimaxillae TaxID=183916 RepID=UPI0003B45CE4|nr:AMP-binding protein [Schaalia vaccimaxillae]